MSRRWGRAAAALLATTLLTAACGGDDGDGDATATPPPAAVQTATAIAGITPTPTADAGEDEPIATGPSASAGRTYTPAQAQTIVSTVPLTPDDLPGAWVVSSDTTTDAAQAAINNPENAASIERCGQLLSRLSTLSPPEADLSARYLEGENVSYFTSLTVYATDEGATDCAAEAAARYASEPAALAEAFGSVFVDTAAVVVTPVTFAPVGAGSFAANLSGTVQAGGFEVEITILIVAWRQGNVSAVVGSAASFDPSTADLRQYVELVAERIGTAQAAE